MNIEEIVQAVEDIVKRYGLKILYMDYTDITIISRVGLSPAVFIQIYVNAKKKKNKYGPCCWVRKNLRGR